MKKYTCNWCKTKQKIKEHLLIEKQLGDRMASGWFSRCVKCKKEHRMLSHEELENMCSFK